MVVTRGASWGTSGGTVLDQAGFSYDGWGNVETYRQDVDSVLGETTPEHEYEVSYTWAKATGGRNSLRRTGITLPSGASVGLDYRSVSGRFDDAVSRVTTLTHGTTVAVAYEYLGLGQVVATDYPEPEIRWRLYEGNTTGDYTDLDRFGRVVHSRWTKYGELPFGMSPPNIYHVELGYDENSNILWADDHVHAGFDVLYGIDGIDRLTRADEGTLDAGSITDRTRDQQWTLDHVGNWNRDKLDLDGDGNFTDPGEWDDCRTHNDVNELLTRDLNCTSPVEHTLGYDAAGNLVDDGKAYKYVYDAFYRLRKILNRSNDALISEHRYNGLGHRIAVHADTDDDGDVDGSDTWEHLAYDERWRLVTRYWAGDTDPHEEYLHHQAGLDGHGGSSYIDLVALRDRDTDDNGSLDERIYYCQNWRADVSALVTAAGHMVEWVKYSAYGVPFGLPAGDADSDGTRDAADRTQIAAWAENDLYDIRGDLNLDGVVDSTDETLASGDVELGRGVLGGVDNRRGAAGQTRVRVGSDFLDVRQRVQSAHLGRFAQREYENHHYDGISMCGNFFASSLSQATFVYAQSGASFVLNEGGHSPNIPEALPQESEDCCRAAQAEFGPEGFAGITICCRGKPVICAWNPFPPGSSPGKRGGGEIVKDCTMKHEAEHVPCCGCAPGQPIGLCQNNISTCEELAKCCANADNSGRNCLVQSVSRCNQYQGQQREICREVVRQSLAQHPTHGEGGCACIPEGEPGSCAGK